MDSLPALTILERSEVSPPPATIGNKSLPLTFSDIVWISMPSPVHALYFYDLPITKTHFTTTIVPNLKQSLSVTLQHFIPFVGKLTIFPTSNKKPEIRYAEGDSVTVTFAESNLDFNDLTGNHPRECDKFYHLIPVLGRTTKVSDYITIPAFALQVTLFPNSGISIGKTIHHSLGDASTMLFLLKAWASIARSGGSDESFLANGTLPIYDRLLNYPKIDEAYVKLAKLETVDEGFKLSTLSGPTDKVRATFILTRTAINGLKKLVSTQLPTLAYVSTFTVACAYIWSCVAKLHIDEPAMFMFVIDCRSRLDPPIPAAYFGNCNMPCFTLSSTTVLKEKDGFLTAAKLIGENLHKLLTDKDGIVKEDVSFDDLFPDWWPTNTLGVAGAPKLNFYDLDFGFGKVRKHELISDYNESISLIASRESSEDLEIGVRLSATKMDVFASNFNSGLESYI